MMKSDSSITSKPADLSAKKKIRKAAESTESIEERDTILVNMRMMKKMTIGLKKVNKYSCVTNIARPRK